MKISKRMKLGALLAVVLVMSLVFAVASSAPATDSNSGNANGQEVKLPDDQRATVVTNIANEPGIGELPMPVFREDVIVYFKEMPVSLEAFASKYGVKLIFNKPDIKMAAFETNSLGEPGKTSQRTLDFINEVSKDPLVEKAFRDGFIFTDPDKVYTLEPKITYPEDLTKQGNGYVPDEAIVGFWRMPPLLDDFESKYGVTLKSADEGLQSITFKTSDPSGFIKKISTDPYVRYAEPNGLVYGSYTPNDTNWNLQWGPEKIYAPEA